MIPATHNNDSAENLYERYVNPQWVRLLDILQMNVSYVRCSGAELHTADGRLILDFNSGYCVHNVGHNHPRVVAAIKDELDKSGPAMLQSHVADLAGELAGRLCELAGGRLAKCSSEAQAAKVSKPPLNSPARTRSAPAFCAHREDFTVSHAGRFL